jgi:tetratricopeptide (TPR) repeat protein
MARYPEAIAAYDRALALRPDDFWSHYWQGDAGQQMQQWERALDCFNRAIDLEPRDRWAWQRRGEILDAMEERA